MKRNRILLQRLKDLRTVLSVVPVLLSVAFSLFHISAASAQSVFEIISSNSSYAASNYRVYPNNVEYPLTPSPEGKHPFYISHYGRHGSRYLNTRSGYDIPYQMMLRADSLNELTPIGKKVLKAIKAIIEDSEERWGDLTGFGREQLRNIGHRMVERFPEVFADSARVDARSTTVNRCILSMGSALQEMACMNPKLQITMKASKRDMWYMNHQDNKLRKGAMTPEAQKAYDEFVKKREENRRFMEMLFLNPDTVRKYVSEAWLNYYVIKMGLLQQNTHNYKDIFLTSLFKNEEIYRFWQWENSWWYIQHGACKLNGGHQPYTQRYLLRQIIAQADSCIRLERPGAQLRFGHETVLLPLACLLGINGYDLETDNLEELEALGWWGSEVFPMGANLQFIFYRSNSQDEDVLFKVLLNEKEATLPIATDCSPYYHWADFRRHYLEKLDKYEQERNL